MIELIDYLPDDIITVIGSYIYPEIRFAYMLNIYTWEDIEDMLYDICYNNPDGVEFMRNLLKLHVNDLYYEIKIKDFMHKHSFYLDYYKLAGAKKFYWEDDSVIYDDVVEDFKELLINIQQKYINHLPVFKKDDTSNNVTHSYYIYAGMMYFIRKHNLTSTYIKGPGPWYTYSLKHDYWIKNKKLQ